MSEELFIGNLSPATDAGDLDRAFARWGGREGVIAGAALVAQSDSYGFVTVDSALAEDAVEALNGSRLQGQTVTVYPASWRHAPEGLGDEPYPTRRAVEGS